MASDSTALLISAYWTITIAAMLAPLVLCVYVAAWFASRAHIQPKPSANPGVIALIIALSVMVLSAAWLHICDNYSCFSLPVWAYFVVQGILLLAVAISWRALGRAQDRWRPPPSNNPVETDAREGARGSP
jgi:hypothetical protein